MKIFGFDPFNALVRKRKVSLERARLAKELVYDAYGDREGICRVGIGPELAYQAFRELFPTTSSFRTCLIAERWSKYYTKGMTENLILIPEGQCESEALIKECDVLIKVGGGPQSEKELQMAVEAGLLTVEVTTDF
jgi:hypothetical protein